MSFLDGVWNVVKTVGGGTGKVLTAATGLLGGLPQMIAMVTNLGGDTRAKQMTIDVVLDKLDGQTGAEHQLIRELPPDVEERLFDHLKEAARVLLYWAAGAYGEAPSAERLQELAKGITDPLLRGSLTDALTSAHQAVVSGTLNDLQSGNGADTAAQKEMPTLPVDAKPPEGLADPLAFIAILEKHRANPILYPVSDQLTIVRDATLSFLLWLRSEGATS